MLTRLPISLAQVHAGNNSQELKNEIRQLLYSLYKSKKISKTVYKNLIATIQKWRRYLRTQQTAKQSIQINLFTTSLTN